MTRDKIVTDNHKIWSTKFKEHNLSSISCWLFNKSFVLETIELLQTNVPKRAMHVQSSSADRLEYNVFNTRVH
jgi:hypothetical protein